MSLQNTGKGQVQQPTVTDSDGAAQFPEFSGQDSTKGGALRDMDFILDIPLELSVELGRTTMILNDLLQLGQGSVVELNKLAGEPLEVLVNGRLVARGEVVVVNEKFGVRITDIISPLERVKQLS
jgi:flagellar motor switch protein FliN/FliY